MRYSDSMDPTQVVDESMEEVLDAWAWWVGEDPARQERMRTALRKYSIDLLDMFDVYMEDE